MAADAFAVGDLDLRLVAYSGAIIRYVRRVTCFRTELFIASTGLASLG